MSDFAERYLAEREKERQEHQRAATPLREDVKHFRVNADASAYRPNYYGATCGDWVSIRVCDDKTNSTRLGVYIGDISRGIAGSYLAHDDGSKILLLENSWHNPAIFVPSLRRVVFGAESWWGRIESPDKLREITDETIDGVWYVQALRALTERGVETP